MSEHIEHMVIIGPALHRERDGYIKGLSEAARKALEMELQAVLGEYGVEVHVQPVMVHGRTVKT